VQNHEAEARSLIRALVDATHFFKTKKAETLAIIKKRCTELRRMQNDEGWECFYETQAATSGGRNPIRSRSHSKRIRVGLKRNPEITEFNPLTLWELHYLREFDDNGYNQPAVRVSTGGR
jgi:hypothetical protein